MPATSFPKDRIRIVLLEGVHPRARERLEHDGFSVEVVDGARSGRELASIVADAHVVGIRSKSSIDQDVLDGAERLLAIGCFCIGTNQVNLAHACRRGIPVFNAPFSNTRSVAELTIAEIIALHRRLGDQSRRMHEGTWDKSSAGAHEVRGRTLGIVGYGRIGSQVSVLAEAMGMHVIYHDLVPRLPMGNARAAASLDDLLQKSDVVTIHVPATDQTRGLIGQRQLATMRDGAFLINNARGSVLDVKALAHAVTSSKLAGAAVDVFPDEPASGSEPFVSELRDLPNVILTPHIGGSTIEAQAGIAEDVATKILRFINIGSTTGAVNVPEVELPEQPTGHAWSDAQGRRPHRILHFHRNVPGVLGKMHAMIAERGANISSEYLRTNEDIGYVVLDVDPTDAEPVIDELRAIPETIRVRELW